MRKSIASYAIIKAELGDTFKYLMQLNVYRNSFNFISGHYEPDKDYGNFELTIIREIGEELPGLVHNDDFFVKSLSRCPLKAKHYSERFKQMTSYEFHLFQFFFLKPLETYAKLWKETPENEWFTLEELLEGSSKNGHTITKFPTIDIDMFLPSGLAGLPPSTMRFNRNR